MTYTRVMSAICSRRHIQLGQADLAGLVQAPAQRLANRLGLLVDLLEHEVLIAALLGGDEVPLDVHHLGLVHDNACLVAHRDTLAA